MRNPLGLSKVNIKPLRGATLSLAAAGGAVLAVAFLPRGAAAADPEDELYWFPDTSEFTTTSSTLDVLGDSHVTGLGELDGYTNPYTSATLAEPQELFANATLTSIPWLDNESATFDITFGDAAIPTGSVIDLSESYDFVAETVEAQGAGLFGLPEITETFFTPLGDFSI